MLATARITIATRTEEARPGRGEDRVAIVEAPGRKLVVVADGTSGILIVATDGLWKYVKPARIAEIAAMRLESALDALVEGVRLRSGALQDDVAIVMCEVQAQP